MFLLHGPILREFLGAVVLASRHFKALSQCEDLTLLLTFESFDRLDRRIFILLHVIVPGGREFLELLALNRLDLNQFFPLLLLHSIALSAQLMVTQLFQFVLGPFRLNIIKLLL